MIETLVAIAILTIAITAPLSLAGLGLKASFVARDQITAFHLALEGVEFVRVVRDTNLIKNVSVATPWLNALPGCGSGTGCRAEFITGTGISFADCIGACPPLKYDVSGFVPLYNYSPGASESKYTRTIQINERVLGVEADVTVTVSWQAGSGTKDVRIETTIFNWF